MQGAVYLHGASSNSQELRRGLPSVDDGRLPVMEQLLSVTGRMFHALTVLGKKDCLVFCSVVGYVVTL